MRLVYGAGFNDRSRPSSVNNEKTKEYNLWTSMLMRCFSSSYQSRQPTYKGCTVSENSSHIPTFMIGVKIK